MTAHQTIDRHDLQMLAYRSDPKVRARNAVIAVDTAMQDNYTATKAALLPHLDPVIVVDNDPWGGTYTLIHGGERETVRPVSVRFELAKSISHTPLGIFVILAPYLKQPDAHGWLPGLSAFRAVLQGALDNVRETDLPADGVAASVRILEGALRFVDASIASGHFSIERFEKFTGSVHDDIAANMRVAAIAQVEGVNTLLSRWKARVGERAWRDLYVVVLSIWTTMVENQNTIIIRPWMDPRRVDTHLIDIATAERPSDPVQVALDNLGRIVMDNVAAEMVFPTDAVLADSLKGTQDLLSNVIKQILGCPHARRTAKTSGAVD